MNIVVLNQYKIKFELLVIGGKTRVNVTSGVIPYFWGYFVNVYPEFLSGEIIPEINKALTGQSFDSDAGGQVDFLTLGQNTSYFSDLSNNQYAIPTIDLKEIILSYIEWINTDNRKEFLS